MDTNNNNKQCECNKPKVVNDLLKRISNLEFDVEDKQREIENLKQINEEHKKINGELRVENERLNNIINELEKWLRSEIKRIEELQNPAKSKVKPYGEEYNNYTLIIGTYDNALDKLQELKGEDKD